MSETIPQQHLANMRYIPRAKFIQMHEGKTFRIWSEKYKAYWGDGSYTKDLHDAGQYTLQEAWNITSYAGADRQLFYERVT